MQLTEGGNTQGCEITLITILEQLSIINPSKNNNEIATKILSFINDNPTLDLGLKDVQNILLIKNTISEILGEDNNNNKSPIYFTETHALVLEEKSAIKILLSEEQKNILLRKITSEKVLKLISIVNKLKNSEK